MLTEAVADATLLKKAALATAKEKLQEQFTPHLEKLFKQQLEDEFLDGDTTEIEEMVDDEELDTDLSDVSDEELELDDEELEIEDENIDDEELDIDLDDLDLEDELEDDDFDAELDEALTEDDENLEDDDLDLDDLDLEDELEDELEDDDLEDDDLDLDDLDLEDELEDDDLEDEDFDDELEEAINQLTQEHRVPKKSNLGRENRQLKRKLEQQRKEIVTISRNLKEAKLTNARMLSVTSLFKQFNLTESLKLKVIKAIDRAKTARESKLVYESLKVSLSNKLPTANRKSRNTKVIKEIKTKRDNTSVSTKNKTILNESETTKRIQRIAGIIKD